MKKVKIPIYGGYLYITNSTKEETSLKFGVDISENTTACVFDHPRGFSHQVVWLSDRVTNAIVAHECVHLCDNVYIDKGIIQDVNNNEPYAYLLTWFFEQIEKYINYES